MLGPGKYNLSDNAYVNTLYMVTLYKQDDQLEDHYNFYHLQLHITVECAFGMLVQQWNISQQALLASFGIGKISALTIRSCNLHNFLINERIEKSIPRAVFHLHH